MENVEIGKEKYLHDSSHVLLLFMHCRWMLMEERSIHRLISQYFLLTVNSLTFVTDDFLFAKMERITKLLRKNVSQLR